MRKDHKPDGRANNGGKREGAGRPPGIPNAPAVHLRDLCRRYTPDIVEKLWEFVEQKNWKKKDPWLAFAAMKELNDRAWGKPRETLLVEQQDAVLLARYPTLDEIKADLIAHGLPIDHLKAPQLIEHEPKR
jgi:hypothetical protein